MGKISLILAIALLVLLLPMPVSAQTEDETLYESNIIAPTGNGTTGNTSTYGDIWHAQSFHVVNPHTVSLVKLYIDRVGTPGYVTVSIRETSGATASAIPTGGDLVSVTVDGDYFPTSQVWYDFPLAETELEGNTSYAIVVRAEYSSVRWGCAIAGVVETGTASDSIDGGYSWLPDLPDFLFQVWGEGVLLINQAAVFTKYMESGDMLFCAEYLNVCPPYYPTHDPARYFQVQLIGIDHTTVLATSPCRAWGNLPASIYLSADSAASLEEGVAYYIRIQGNFGSQPSGEYQLTADDWQGKDLDLLDAWCIRTARSMEVYSGILYTGSDPARGAVLNGEGGPLFDRGIPYLYETRPDLFQVAPHALGGYPFGDPNIGMGGDWETTMGSDFTTSMGQAGGIVGLTAKEMATALAIAVFLTLALVCSIVGSAGMGLVLASPVPAFAAWAGFWSPSAFAIMIIAFAYVFVAFFWWRTT